MTIKTRVKAGGKTVQHNERSLRVRTGIKAGADKNQDPPPK